MNDEEMQKAREVVAIVNRRGWTQIEDFIKDNIKPIEKRLFNDDLEQEEFKVLQAERKAYTSVLDFVDRRMEIVKNQ